MGTRTTSLLCCTMSVLSLGQLGALGVPKRYFYAILILLLWFDYFDPYFVLNIFL